MPYVCYETHQEDLAETVRHFRVAAAYNLAASGTCRPRPRDMSR